MEGGRMDYLPELTWKTPVVRGWRSTGDRVSEWLPPELILLTLQEAA
jgi:hypothetical protein